MLDEAAVVYVVDDDPAVLTATAVLLRTVGMQVKSFASAEEFLAAYDASQTGCLLVDVGLPGMSGVALQQKLAVEEVDLSVILISGHAGEDVPTNGDGTTAGVLEKPIDSRRLIEHVQRAMGRHDKQSSAATR